MCGHQRVLRIAVERQFAGKQFVQRNTERINVGTRVGGFTAHLFRWHVIQRAQRGAGGSERAVCGRARDAEVHQLHNSLWREHHVGWLDVAMDDVLFVRVTERRENLVGVVDRFGGRDRRSRDAVGQRFAFHELHDHHQLIFVRQRRTQGGDIGMVQRGQQANFTQEAIGETLIRMQVGQ